VEEEDGGDDDDGNDDTPSELLGPLLEVGPRRRLSLRHPTPA